MKWLDTIKLFWVAALVLMSGSAFGQGFYVAGGAAYAWRASADSVGDATQGRTANAFENGYAARGALGYDFKPVRLEGELNYNRNDVDTQNNSLAGGGNRAGSGNSSIWSLMGNAYFDIATGSSFTPYAGIGIGWARVAANDISATGLPVVSDDTDTVFAYQGILGVAYELTREIALTLEYRHFRTNDFTIANSGGKTNENDGARINSLGLGFRYSF